MPKRLEQMTIEETSGVDHPAHEREGWLIMKSADAVPTPEEALEEPEMTKFDPSTLPAEAQDYIKSLEAEVESAKATPAPAPVEAPADDAMAKAREGLSDEFRKAFDAQLDEIKKAAESDRAAAAEARAIAEAERDQRLQADRIAKAKSLSNLPVSADEVGRVLHELDALPTPVAKDGGEQPKSLAVRVEEMLKAANGAIDTARLYGELGSSIPEAGSPDAELESLAKAKMADTPNLTFEAAYAKAVEENPDLYTRILNA